MTIEIEREMLTHQEVCAIIGVRSKRTLLKVEGLTPIKVGGTWRWSRAAVMKFAAGN